MPNRLSSEQWSRYWEKGTITTFLGRFQNNYDGLVLKFWQEQLSELPNTSKIIDLGTGNGALALIAATYGDAESKEFQVTAINYANIDPLNNVLSKQPTELVKKIDFRSKVSMEDTGFEDASFDCAISQFGFEYGSPAATIFELGRILRDKAGIIVMMHRQGSVLHQQAVEGIEQASICLASELTPKLKDLCVRLDQLRQQSADPATDDRAEELRNIVNTKTGQLHAAMDARTDKSQLSYYLENSMALFQPRYAGKSLDEKLAMLDQVTDETAAYGERMADLVSAAKSSVDIEDLKILLQKSGFKVHRCETFMLDGYDFCESLVARR